MAGGQAENRKAAEPGSRISTGVALVVWLALIVAANRGGQALLDRGVEIRILAPPLVGRFASGPRNGFTLWLLGAPLVAGGLIGLVRGGKAERLTWRRLLWAAFGAAVVWAVALAAVSGWESVSRPMALPGHYLLDVPSVDEAGGPHHFLRSFTDRIDGYGTHVRAHPPGFVLLLWMLDRIGLGGAGWAAALAIAGGAAAVPAVLLAVRELAGEATARRAAPFLVLAPAALYVASTADALFAGVGSWATALLVLATGQADRRRGAALATGGGLLFGAGLLLSYGLALLGLIALAVAAHRRQVWPLGPFAGAAAATLIVSGLAGFWWPDGLDVTRREYRESVAAVRPYGYFLYANLAALALTVGPAVAAGLARLRSWRGGIGPLVGGAMAAVAAANLTGLSKGETERIWLPFTMWILPAAAVVARDRRSTSRWLAAQAAVALSVEVFVRTHW